MVASHVAITWTGTGLQFEAPHAEHPFKTDGDGVAAHSPVQLLLLALAGCTAADVIDIATKMRVGITGLEVSVEGERNSEPPRYFKKLHVRYTTRGVSEEDREKIERAIHLSEEKYCSVHHSLRKDIDFSSELVLG